MRRVVRVTGTDALTFLQGLVSNDVLPLAKAPGAREQRWAHLLCGPVDLAQLASAEAAAGHAGSQSELAQRVGLLESEVAQLRETVQKLCSELGIVS